MNCPHCSKKIDAEKLKDITNQITCPNCREVVPLNITQSMELGFQQGVSILTGKNKIANWLFLFGAVFALLAAGYSNLPGIDKATKDKVPSLLVVSAIFFVGGTIVYTMNQNKSAGE